jgi:hypothetical protein
MVGTLLGSIVFGWKRQILWLAAPPILFIGYAFLEVGRGGAWGKRGKLSDWHGQSHRSFDLASRLHR